MSSYKLNKFVVTLSFFWLSSFAKIFILLKDFNKSSFLNRGFLRRSSYSLFFLTFFLFLCNFHHYFSLKCRIRQQKISRLRKQYFFLLSIILRRNYRPRQFNSIYIHFFLRKSPFGTENLSIILHPISTVSYFILIPHLRSSEAITGLRSLSFTPTLRTRLKTSV